MESLLTAQLNHEGVHVYVATVRPFMKIKTDEGKEYYDLWFILEGRGVNRGSVLQARCRCKGGSDGGCKHIAAAMYALEDLLNTRGNDSVTSGPCIWVKRPRANTQACEVKDLVIEKGKKPSHKKENVNTRTTKILTRMSVLLTILIHQMRSILKIYPKDVQIKN